MILFLKAHVQGYTRHDGIYIGPHEDRRAPAAHEEPADPFADDMAKQFAWLTERAKEEGFTDVDDMLERDPSLFARLATSWRERNPMMAKAIDALLADWTAPTPAQAKAGNYKKPRVHWNGLEIAIENPAGSVREGRGWRTVMQNDYGYVCRSEAVDGDEVDVYLGPDLDTAPTVYVVHQRRAGDWKAYDEDKCMLGFESESAARAAYLKHYDDPRFLGPITAMPVAEFVRKVRATADKPGMVKSVLLFRSKLGLESARLCQASTK